MSVEFEELAKLRENPAEDLASEFHASLRDLFCPYRPQYFLAAQSKLELVANGFLQTGVPV